MYNDIHCVTSRRVDPMEYFSDIEFKRHFRFDKASVRRIAMLLEVVLFFFGISFNANSFQECKKRRYANFAFL